MPDNPLLKQALTTAVTVAVILIAVLLYGQFGPGLPLSVVNTNRQDFFSATGEGKVTVTPNAVDVTLGITTQAPTVTEAQRQANEVINRVTAELKKLGIAEEDIKTTNYNLHPDYENLKDGGPLPLPPVPTVTIEPSAQGAPGRSTTTEIMPVPPRPTPSKYSSFTADISLQVKVRDLNKVNQVVDAATAAGVNQVNSINFTVSDLEKYQKEARDKAIADAKKKASELASATGLRLGRIVNVYESPIFYPGPYAAKAEGYGGAPFDGSTQLQPGTTEVVMSVTLNYETR